MGTHGRTGRDRVANLGSVTERVLESVDLPVLVVDIGD
jgi:nucleotide-binding universal stress UspA family protein